MEQIFFPPDGLVTDRESAAFLKRMMELYERFKSGVLSPEFTLKSLQNSIEGKYEFQTKFGILKLFGSPVEVWDNDTYYGFGPDSFFKDSPAESAEMNEAAEKMKLLPLFEFRPALELKPKSCPPYVAFLAPYTFSKKEKLGKILDEINSFKLYPSITLGHIKSLMKRNLSSVTKNEIFFEGESGNYFLIRDIQGDSWLVWVWRHNGGRWYYRFLNTKEALDGPLHKDARLWLLAPLNLMEKKEGVNPDEHLIDCDATPYIPEGWSLKKHKKGGMFKFNPGSVSLFLPEMQKKGVVLGTNLFKMLSDVSVLNANIMDYLFKHPAIIPENWKGKSIFFWGTIYRHSDRGLCVRCLRWDGLVWFRDYHHLDVNFYPEWPAIIAR